MYAHTILRISVSVNAFLTVFFSIAYLCER
nr:MAG TPA: hypothetical protein [Caudoviricetes sp.]